jgi:hypothetical protein
MIGGYPIGAEPVGAFRRILSAGVSGIAGIAAASIVISASATVAVRSAGVAGLVAATPGLAGGAVHNRGEAVAGLAIAGAAGGALRTSAIAGAGLIITGSASGIASQPGVTFSFSTRRSRDAGLDILGGDRSRSAGGSIIDRTREGG